MNLSIVIPNRDDPFLRRTLERIRDTTAGDPPEIVVVNDGPQKLESAPIIQGLEVIYISTGLRPKGTSFSRHAGVVAARREHVFTIDAHMDFRDDGWAGRIVDELEKDRRQVLCCKMLALDSLAPRMSNATAVYRGAHVYWKTTELNGARHVLPGKWANNAVGEISCVMGACYAFRRDWYLSGLLEPWRLGLGWGMDEETLSITNWICGGTTRLIDVEVGHVMGSTYKKPFFSGQAEMMQVWVNRFRMIEVLPFGSAARAELRAWLMRNACCRIWKPQIDCALSAMRLAATIGHLSAQKRTMADFTKEWDIAPASAPDTPHGHSIKLVR